MSPDKKPVCDIGFKGGQTLRVVGVLSDLREHWRNNQCVDLFTPDGEPVMVNFCNASFIHERTKLKA